jgi:hypothetical protein
VKANGSLGGASQLRELSEVVRFLVRSFIHNLSTQSPSRLQLHRVQTGSTNMRWHEERFPWLQLPSCHQLFALGVQRLDQFADLGIVLA